MVPACDGKDYKEEMKKDAVSLLWFLYKVNKWKSDLMIRQNRWMG
jgi:hypothetical protein